MAGATVISDNMGTYQWKKWIGSIGGGAAACVWAREPEGYKKDKRWSVYIILPQPGTAHEALCTNQKCFKEAHVIMEGTQRYDPVKIKQALLTDHLACSVS